MNLDAFRLAAESNLWGAIVPELALGSLALLLLVLEMVLPKSKHSAIPGVAILGQLGVLLWILADYRTGYLWQETFAGLIRHTPSGQFMRVFFVLCSIFVSALGVVSLAKQRMPKIEFFHIVIVVAAAMMLLAQSNHFVMLFVALETVTVGFYILVSYYRTNPLSLEAGLKYLIMGALSSGLLLFGIVLLYGVAGNPGLPQHAADSMHFGQLRAFLEANPGNFIASAGIVLVLAGIAFKIGVVPFQIWIPDVYQGAPTPVTAFLAVGSKAAGFAILLPVALGAFAPYQSLVIAVLSVITAATIIFGNVAALPQSNVKRLIGLSGVSHAGYLLLGVIAAYIVGDQAIDAVLFYLAVYLVASFAVFGVMTHVAGANDADQDLDHYADLAKTHPFLAGVLAVGVGSLAGIPPLAGFIGKLLIFIAAYKAGLLWLLAIAVAGVIVSIYYYFGWIRAAFFATWRAPLAQGEVDPRPARTPVTMGLATVMLTLALLSVLLGFYQAPITAWLAAAH